MQLAAVFALTLATTGISVGFNFLGRDFYNALASLSLSLPSFPFVLILLILLILVISLFTEFCSFLLENWMVMMI